MCVIELHQRNETKLSSLMVSAAYPAKPLGLEVGE
jgi:hypothetical protein